MTTATLIKPKEENINTAETNNLNLFNYLDRLNQNYWLNVSNYLSSIFQNPKFITQNKFNIGIIKEEKEPEFFNYWTIKPEIISASETAEIIFEDSFNIKFENNLKLEKLELNAYYLSEWFEIITKSLQNTSSIGSKIYDWHLKTSEFLNKHIQIELYKNLIFQNIENYFSFFEINLEIESLKNIYIFKNKTLIENYLNKNNNIIYFLKKYYIKIREFFTDNIKNISLEYDSDFEEDFEALFIIIKTNLSYKKSLDILDNFYKNYWINIAADIRQVVSVCIDENSK